MREVVVMAERKGTDGMGMKENEIERILANEVKRLGGRAYKWVSPGNDGVPDRIVILPNMMPIFVELKTDTGRLSPLQKNQIQRLEGLGQQVEIVKGISGLRLFFEDLGFLDAASRIATRYGSD